jgi:hypothetical protein
VQNQLRWQQLLVGKLNEKVKLVGATISCEGSPFEGKVDGEWRTNPHVQSYVLATDQVRTCCKQGLVHRGTCNHEVQKQEEVCAVKPTAAAGLCGQNNARDA